MTDQALLRQFVDTFTPDQNVPPVSLRKGKVTAVNSAARTCSIQLAGDTTTTITDVRYLSSYVPLVDHVVEILMAGPSILVIGRVNAHFRRPFALARRTSSQAVGHGTDSTIGWNETTWSVGGGFGTNEYVAKQAGLHLAVAATRWDSYGSWENYSSLWKNADGGQRFGHHGGWHSGSQSWAALVNMAVNDTLRMVVFQNSGATRNVITAFGWGTSMGVLYLGDAT